MPKLKSMKKLILLVAVLWMASPALKANDLSKLLGIWDYTVPYAPSEYSKGQMVFVEKEGTVTGEIKIQGYAIPIKNLKVVDGNYSFGVEVEYNYIPITAKLEGEIFNGKVSTPEGDMTLTATRKAADQN